MGKLKTYALAVGAKKTRGSSQLLGIIGGSGEILLHAPDQDWVRREPSTVSLLHNLTIAKRNTPFAQFESGLSTGVKHE